MNKEKLYESFGELIYAVVTVNEVVQPDELETIKTILKEYEWGDDVIWSLDYETRNNRSVREAYSRAFETFVEYGPFEDYDNFFVVLDKIAEARQHINDKERKVIGKFKRALLEHFMEDEGLQSDEEDLKQAETVANGKVDIIASIEENLKDESRA